MMVSSSELISEMFRVQRSCSLPSFLISFWALSSFFSIPEISVSRLAFDACFYS